MESWLKGKTKGKTRKNHNTKKRRMWKTSLLGEQKRKTLKTCRKIAFLGLFHSGATCCVWFVPRNRECFFRGVFWHTQVPVIHQVNFAFFSARKSLVSLGNDSDATCCVWFVLRNREWFLSLGGGLWWQEQTPQLSPETWTHLASLTFPLKCYSCKMCNFNIFNSSLILSKFHTKSA